MHHTDARFEVFLAGVIRESSRPHSLPAYRQLEGAPRGADERAALTPSGHQNIECSPEVTNPPQFDA
eukprot:5909520-Prymnesium_polylepis.1